MKNYFKPIPGLLLLFISFSSIAQPQWTVYSNSNSSIDKGPYRAIAIDASGDIWTGGMFTGLHKFDGSKWTAYNPGNSNILDDNIYDIVIDDLGRVWAANYRGISVFNGSTFINYDTSNAAFNGMTVYCLAKDNNGKIWLSSRNGSFGFEGITTYDGNNWTNLTGYPSQLSDAEFSDYAFATNNDAWIACKGGMTKYNGSNFIFYPPITSLPRSERVGIDADGNVWVGGFDALVKYDGSNWTKYDNTTDLRLGTNTFYYDIFPDGDILWIGTSRGFLKFDRKSAIILENYDSTNSPLKDYNVNQISKDLNGNLWLATSIGVVKMNPNPTSIEEVGNVPHLNIYPNPATDYFNINIKDYKNSTLEVLDISGRVIKKCIIESANTSVKTGELPEGIYILKIKSPSRTYVQRFIKKAF